MHGKKRAEYKARLRDPKTAAALTKKADQWNILMKELQDRRRHSKEQKKHNDIDKEDPPVAGVDDDATITDVTATTLALLGKALLVNPDPMNLWNHRRELIIQEQEQQSSSATDTETDVATTGAKILERERALTMTALQRNPKAYGAWFHRKWILERLRPSTKILQEELGLTSTFLSADERNFHCWNYRRFIVACLAGSWDGEWNISVDDTTETSSSPSLMGPQVVDKETSEARNTKPIVIPQELIRSEFEFTTSKIEQNFSNFSAFHYRSQLLDLCDDNDNGNVDIEEIMEKEFQLIENAVCTEPDDQTCWWYHAILLDKLSGHNNNMPPRLQEQADLFRDILEDSPESKWVILGLFRVLQILGTYDEDAAADDSSVSSKEERERLLQRLMKIDPYRSQRYEELRRKME